MVLTLLICSETEWVLRKRLNELNQFVPNQIKKPTQNPTLKWIFTLFIRVTEVRVNAAESTKCKSTNLNDNLKK